MQRQRQRRQLAHRLLGPGAGIRVAALGDRRRDLRDHRGLAIGGQLEGAQMPCLQTEFTQGLGGAGQRDGVAVEIACRAGGDQVGADQFGQELLVDPGLFEQIRPGDPDLVIEPEFLGRNLTGHGVQPPQAAAIGGGVGHDGPVSGIGHDPSHSVRPGPRLADPERRRPTVDRFELFLDHLQRQVLIPLRGQHEAQALDVGHVEAAVPRGRALRADQALRFQESDLGDGDVRKIRTQEIQHGADRHASARPLRCASHSARSL